MQDTYKTTPGDFFFHLGATIALYVSAVALIDLAFSIVNRALPDVLSSYFNAGSIIWPISMLIILVPILYLIEWHLGRGIKALPAKKDIWIRKWRIYLTLFLAGATIAGDLIALINTYLNGEITSRFVYKVCIVFVVFAIIFIYYFIEQTLKESRVKLSKIMASLGIVVVLATIVSGFIVVGSPAGQRALRLDTQRINDLSNIQNEVVNYWQQTGKLPVALVNLNDKLQGIIIPTDPVTHAVYEYSIKSTTAFELCATFSASSTDVSTVLSYPSPYPMGGLNVNWEHDVGRVCFDRTIDPTRYPQNPQNKAI